MRSASERLGFLDATGHLRNLDSLQQVDLVIELETATGISIPPEEAVPEVFTSIEKLAALLQKISPSS